MSEQETTSSPAPSAPTEGSTPATPEASHEEAPSSQFDVSDDVFDGLGDDDFSQDESAKPIQKPQQPSPAVEQVASGPVPVTQQAQQLPAAAAPPPQAPVQPGPGAAPQAPVGQGQSPGQPQAAQQTWGQLMDAGREGIINDMAVNHFGLTPKEAELADAGDPGWIPHYGARVAYESVRSTVAIIEKALPQMILQVTAVQQAQRDAEEEMFKDFSDLRPLRNKVFQLGHTIRQLNPTLPRKEFIQLLGMQARHLFGTKPPEPVTVAAHVRQPPQRGGGNGFQPIVSSVPSAVRSTAVDPNDWAAALDAMDNL